jgi:hypothetical protein
MEKLQTFRAFIWIYFCGDFFFGLILGVIFATIEAKVMIVGIIVTLIE